MEETWRTRAECRDAPTDLFFPTFLGHTAERDEADYLAGIRDRYCDPCPVSEECRAAGRGQVGIWAGETETTRRRALRRRQREDRTRRAS